MFCKFCGNQMPDEAKFCPVCGQVQEQQAQQPQQPQQPQQQAQPTYQAPQPTYQAQRAQSAPQNDIVSKAMNGDANSALVFSILGFAFSWSMMPLLGLIFSIIGKSKVNSFYSRYRKSNGRVATGRNLSGWGIAISIIGMVVMFILTIVYIVEYAALLSYYF